MLKFAANLTMLFPEWPFMERFKAAKEAGFDAVEILFPDDYQIDEIQHQLVSNCLHLVLINAPARRNSDQPKGFAAIPEGQAVFRQDFRRALSVARRLGAEHLHLMSGVAEGQQARATFIENMRWAAAQAPLQSLTIEPINHADMPGYFLNDFGLALDILQEVNAPNLHLQFDAYHAHRITGDVMAVWGKCADQTRHVQVGGFPGRHEPKQCDIDYQKFFAALDVAGYKGWVSGEYNPAGKTEDGLAWIK